MVKKCKSIDTAAVLTDLSQRCSVSVPPVTNNIYRSAVPAQNYLPERRSAAFRHHYRPGYRVKFEWSSVKLYSTLFNATWCKIVNLQNSSTRYVKFCFICLRKNLKILQHVLKHWLPSAYTPLANGYVSDALLNAEMQNVQQALLQKLQWC